jgi:gliding motility-associated-like protein
MSFGISKQLQLFVFVSYFMLLNLVSNAQLNTPNVIASSGGYFANANFSNSYTIGEMCVVETDFVNGDMLTQGFQQPDDEPASDDINPELFIPNGFSPNGDGYNDTWDIPYLNDYPESVVKVFNRWGQELYSGKGNSNPWNGTFKGKDLPTADYYYVIIIEQLNKKLTGTVTLKK